MSFYYTWIRTGGGMGTSPHLAMLTNEGKLSYQHQRSQGTSHMENSGKGEIRRIRGRVEEIRRPNFLFSEFLSNSVNLWLGIEGSRPEKTPCYYSWLIRMFLQWSDYIRRHGNRRKDYHFACNGYNIKNIH